MEKISTTTGLRAAILYLESKQMQEGFELREQFKLAYDSLKPLNLIRSVFVEAAGSQDLQNNLINNSLGVTAGYLSKYLFEGAMKSPLQKLIGTTIMFGIKNIIIKNPEAVKAMGKSVLNIFTRKRGEVRT
ncbi:MAG: hypothetical protein AB9834_14050 [Lentimicrobium sp.]